MPIMNSPHSARSAPNRSLMPTLRRGCATVMAALALGIVSIPGVAAETVLRVAYPETENTPRISGRGDAIPADKPGTTIELLRMAAEKVGVTLEFTRAPWKRCLYLLENAYTDAIFHASYTEERARFAVYPTRGGKPDASRAVFLNRYAIYVKKGAGVTWNGRMLSNVGKPLGTLAGNAVVEDLKRLGHAVEVAPGVRSNMEKLVADRIAAYVEIEGVGDDFLADYRTEFAAIEKLPLPFEEKPYYIVLSQPFYQQNPKLSEAFFDAIRDVQASPAYRKMLLQYR